MPEDVSLTIKLLEGGRVGSAGGTDGRDRPRGEGSTRAPERAEREELRKPSGSAEDLRREAARAAKDEIVDAEVIASAFDIFSGSVGSSLAGQAESSLLATGAGIGGTLGGSAGAGVGGALAGGLATLGPVGLAIGGAALVVGAFTETIRFADSALQDMAENLAVFSAPLSQAQARARVLEIQDKIRASEVLGRDLAAFTDTRSELASEVRDLKLQVAKFIVPFASGVAKDLADIASFVISDLKSAADFIGIDGKTLARETRGVLPIFKELKGAADLIRLLKKWFGDNDKKKGGIFELYKDFLDPGQQLLNPIQERGRAVDHKKHEGVHGILKR